MGDVPDGDVDPDTGHCTGAREGGCAEAAAATLLWVAGTLTSENHLDFAIENDGPGGTTMADLASALAGILAGSAWMIATGAAIDAPARAARALLIEVVWPSGDGHVICIIPDRDGVWVHDPAEETRIRATWDQVAAYRVIAVIRLVPRGMA